VRQIIHSLRRRFDPISPPSAPHGPAPAAIEENDEDGATEQRSHERHRIEGQQAMVRAALRSEQEERIRIAAIEAEVRAQRARLAEWGDE
jgi:hypothetical protein